jgi:NTE family protein
MMGKALVLGGGGPVGIAWESGLLAGLAQAGADLSQADFILGTSAGSFVGAQIAMGRSIAGLAEPFLAMKAASERPASSSGPAAGPPPDLRFLLRKMAEAASGERPAQTVRAELGAWAANASPMSEEAFIESFGGFLAGLPKDAWPQRNYACTAVDIESGAFRLWDKAAGVGLARAVASSCSVPGVYPPITIEGRRYMDGGMRSPTNADMAKGYALVVVIAIRIDAGPGGAADGGRRDALDAEIDALRSAGAQVELIAPDAASRAAFGPNLMDPRRRWRAAEAGLAQAQAAAPALAAVWNA